jgi:hypothetical protein
MANQGTYRLPTIAAISPSLAETLRNCPLQAAISRIGEVRAYVLANPKAWLGTAYHHVFEHLWEPSPLDDKTRINELWTQAIAALQARAREHPLNKRFDNPEQWPGYHLVHAFVVLRAKKSLQEQPRKPAAAAREGVVLREREFTAMGGRLVGKPDVIVGNEIRDFKSGQIYDETTDGKQTIKEAYVRQMRLYGRLVEEQLGMCPRKGVLVPMQGAAVEVSLDPQACAAEADEAVGLLDAYRCLLDAAFVASDLATPSAQACRWCQYKTLCPAFWENVNEAWTESLGSACVRGTLGSPPQLIHNDKAFALAMTNTSGSSSVPLTIAPLERTVHANVVAWKTGDVIRVINLYRRNDGQLSPTTSTVCLRETDCPTFTLPVQTPQPNGASFS